MTEREIIITLSNNAKVTKSFVEDQVYTIEDMAYAESKEEFEDAVANAQESIRIQIAYLRRLSDALDSLEYQDK